MYYIGICDDAKNMCASIENMILKYAKENKISVEPQIWYSGQELCRYLDRGNHLDILFLDIELLEVSGIQVGKFIRNRLEDRGMQIIYISAKFSCAQELFKIQPMDFLVKPIEQSEVNETLALARKILKKEKEKFEFQNGREHYYIPFGDIMYFASEGREVKLRTPSEEKKFYGKLKDMIERLPKEFIMIHHSYVVNRKYIINYCYETVRLSDESVLPISKNKRKEVREKLLGEGQ